MDSKDSRKLDCIYYEEEYEDMGMHHCKYSHTLYEHNEKDIMCNNCRLWDAYIPKSSNRSQIDKAIEWQNKQYDEQEDYYKHFKYDI